MNAPREMIDHPQHYNGHPSGIETIEASRLLPFNLGNALKYVMRRGDKGTEQQDLAKAEWYLVDELNQLGNTAKVVKVGEALLLLNAIACSEENQTAKRFYAAMYQYIDSSLVVYRKFYLRRMISYVKKLKDG